MKLTDHFTLAELTHSQAADRKGLDNTPPPDVITRLAATGHGLEMIRALVQCPIIISSGYRSPAVNAAVGGAKASQHLTGQAADITAPWFGPPKNLMAAIIKANLPFDQCILEYAGQGGGWVHVSFTDKPRGQALVIDHDGTRLYT
jgi:zinc D-Ala-D-Ala carboxypeptidase